MIDTHAHIDFLEFDQDREQVIQRYIQNQGKSLINVSCDMSSSHRSVSLSNKYNNIFTAIGVHPHSAGEVTPDNLHILETLMQQPKVIAIGEVGLDFFKTPYYSAEIQEQAFRSQIALALKYNKPLIIHCRDAYMEILHILKSYNLAHWRGVLHCCMTNYEIAQEFVDLGFHLGFNGVITFYKKHSLELHNVQEILQKIPLQKILTETDSPYLAPTPYRGQRNEPAHTTYVIQKIAEITQIPSQTVEEITEQNALQLFNI